MESRRHIIFSISIRRAPTMIRSFFLLVLFFTSPFAAVVVHAEDKKAGIAISGGNYGQVILGLAAVLALIYALAYVARRLNGSAMPGNLPIKIVGGTSLGVREKVVLIDVGGKHILIGVAPGRVNTLHVFDEPLDLTREKRAEAAFAVRLKQILSQGESK